MIDYERLLTSLTVTRLDNEEVTYELAYSKGAISVIENVVYAHDAERKWIQSHPVILYEIYILQHIMAALSQELDTGGQKLFSPASLSEEGQVFDRNLPIRLLCDDDIIFLMKSRYKSHPIVAEYFDRRQRRHPLWKSEAEYRAYFLGKSKGGELLSCLESAMKTTAEYLSKSTTSWVIDDALIAQVQHELDALDTAGLDERKRKTQKRDKQKILNIVTCLRDYAYKAGAGYDCNFILLKSSQFNSSFSKTDFSSIKIVFPTENGDKVVCFGDTVSSLNGIASERDDYFYLFYNRQDQQKALDINHLCHDLFELFL